MIIPIFDPWEHEEYRAKLKQIFGNRKNYLNFLRIAKTMEFEIWKRMI